MSAAEHRVPISEYPEIPFEYAAILGSLGVRDHLDLLKEYQGAEKREQLARRTGIPLRRLDELLALCRLSDRFMIGGVEAREQYRKLSGNEDH